MKIIIIAAIAVCSVAFTQAGNNQGNKNSSKTIFTAQPSALEFGYFRVHRMGRDASLNWSVSNPSGVEYFTIERSFDGSYFETIDEVECAGDATLRYRDVSCFPGYIYYRIQAHQSDGTVVISPVELLHMVAKK